MIKFNVDERNRIVTAYFADSNGDAFRERDWVAEVNSRICKIMGGKIHFMFMMDISPVTCPYAYRAVSDLYGNYRSIAKCDPNDEFDTEIGKKIASKRLLKKLNKCLWRALKYMYMNSLKDMNTIRKNLLALEHLIDEEKYIEPGTRINQTSNSYLNLSVKKNIKFTANKAETQKDNVVLATKPGSDVLVFNDVEKKLDRYKKLAAESGVPVVTAVQEYAPPQKLATCENSNKDEYVPNKMSLGEVLAKEAITAANLPDCASPNKIAKSLQKDLDTALEDSSQKIGVRKDVEKFVND